MGLLFFLPDSWHDSGCQPGRGHDLRALRIYFIACNFFEPVVGVTLLSSNPDVLASLPSGEQETVFCWCRTGRHHTASCCFARDEFADVPQRPVVESLLPLRSKVSIQEGPTMGAV